MDSTDEMTGHGFRSVASTLLNEQGCDRDAIERQLAHWERDAVRAAYNYAQHLPERRKMMQEWADCLETLRAKANVRCAPVMDWTDANCFRLSAQKKLNCVAFP